jgi:hypothetical protein
MVFGERCLSVLIQEFIGSNLQVILQAYDVVWGESKMKSSTTMGKTLNVLMASEAKSRGRYGYEYDFLLSFVCTHK